MRVLAVMTFAVLAMACLHDDRKVIQCDYQTTKLPPTRQVAEARKPRHRDYKRPSSRQIAPNTSVFTSDGAGGLEAPADWRINIECANTKVSKAESLVCQSSVEIMKLVITKNSHDAVLLVHLSDGVSVRFSIFDPDTYSLDITQDPSTCTLTIMSQRIARAFAIAIGLLAMTLLT